MQANNMASSAAGGQDLGRALQPEPQDHVICPAPKEEGKEPKHPATAPRDKSGLPVCPWRTVKPPSEQVLGTWQEGAPPAAAEAPAPTPEGMRADLRDCKAAQAWPWAAVHERETCWEQMGCGDCGWRGPALGGPEGLAKAGSQRSRSQGSRPPKEGLWDELSLQEGGSTGARRGCEHDSGPAQL